MTDEWEMPAAMPARRRRRWPWWLLLALLLFAGGVASALYVIERSARARDLLHLTPPVVAAPVRVVARPVAVLPPAVAVQTQATAQRLARVEQGLAQVAARATETSDNAGRAESLLIAFAARRALDRGTDLGYLEGLLRERFGGQQPAAVATILSAAHTPVTLEELQTGLEAVAPSLVTRDANDGWWQGVRRELAGLIVVRRGSAPATAPGDRLDRARRQLQAGHVDLALAEVARMPGRDTAAAWIVKARRYASARQALDAIETAALLAPHGVAAAVTAMPGVAVGETPAAAAAAAATPGAAAVPPAATRRGVAVPVDVRAPERAR